MQDGKKRFFDLLALDFGVDERELQAAMDALPLAKVYLVKPAAVCLSPGIGMDREAELETAAGYERKLSWRQRQD